MSDEATREPTEMSVEWHDIRDPNDPRLDRLAAQYDLHPLHIEDCRHRGQRAKAEELGGYLFVVLKTIECGEHGEMDIGDLDIFLGPTFVITVQESGCAGVSKLLDGLRANWGAWTRGDELLYRIMDGVVDTYLPVLDRFSESIDELEDAVLDDPKSEHVQHIFGVKRALIQMRRVMVNTRDVAGYLQRTESEVIGADMWPFLRDVYDHVTRNLDLIETQRDLINGSLDIYLSSVANRTNRVMKVLTVVGTIALPALIISGFYGMNVEGLPLAHSAHGFAWITGIVTGMMVLLLAILQWLKWL